MSLRKELRSGILYVTLDTQGAEVNVLTLDAASSLEQAVGEVDPATVRALVVRSAKPRSFLNGAGLLMHSRTLKSCDEILRLTKQVRHAYRALKRCPVPTVAAIRGNCYGCGVELALQCRYRIASDDRDTRFYMTELADYLMIPTFGATQDLPALLGLEHAADLLLWGEHWSARRALERGLVDRCLDPVAFEGDVDAFVETIVAPGHPAPPPPSTLHAPAPERDSLQKRIGDRIRMLPPAYRHLYATCFDLMQRDDGAGYEREAREAARSALAPCSKAATRFFFLRHAARTLALQGGSDALPAERLDSSSRGLVDLCADTQGRVTLSERFTGRPFDPPEGVVIHAPFQELGIDVAEVPSLGAGDPGTEQAVSAALVARYFTVLRTRPRGPFVLDDLLAAWLLPQLAYLRSGGTPSNLAASLRAFGFTRFPGDWVRALGPETFRVLAASNGSTDADSSRTILALPHRTCDDGVDDPIVMHALLASLGGFAARALRDGSVAHVTFVDVAARDVIDFPLQHTSLCRYLTQARCADLMQRVSTFRGLVSVESMSSFVQFADRGRPFYQGDAYRQ